MTRAEFEVWSRIYTAAIGPWTARLVDTMRSTLPGAVSEAVASAASTAADKGLEVWRGKRAGVAEKGRQ